MRIAIVLGPFFPVPPVLGGAVEKAHLLLAKTYAARGNDVTIISRRYKDFPIEEMVQGIRHIRLRSFDRTSSLIVNLLLDFIYAFRVSRNLPQSDLTITNSFFTPLLLHRRTAGKIYVHVARYPKRQMFLYFRVDRLQAISQEVAAAIAREAPHLKEKVVAIGYPVPDVFFPSDIVQRRQNTVLYVGRLAREKGVHLLIDAFIKTIRNRKSASEWTLRIVGPHETSQGGDGIGYLNELLRMAEPLGSVCQFIGPVFNQEKLIEEYRSALVFAYPSLAESGEALGLAPLEAMAAGCAVIASDLRCFDDFADGGRSLLRFNHRNLNAAEDLAAKIGELVDNPRLIEEIVKNGHATASKFRLETIAGKMLRDFESIVTV